MVQWFTADVEIGLIRIPHVQTQEKVMRYRKYGIGRGLSEKSQRPMLLRFNPGSGSIPARSGQGETVEEGRVRRLTALRKIAGLWKNRLDIPTDGMEYQRLMRNQ